MKRLTSLAVAGLFALGVAGFFGTSDQVRAEDPIVIGAAIALSGFVQPYDDGPLKGGSFLSSPPTPSPIRRKARMPPSRCWSRVLKWSS